MSSKKSSDTAQGLSNRKRVVRIRITTSHAIFRSRANPAKNDLPFKRAKNN